MTNEIQNTENNDKLKVYCNTCICHCCDKLNSTITKLENIRDIFSDKLDQLNSNNEKLRESRDYYKQIVEGCPEICDNGFCQIDHHNKELKQVLNRIKEIAQNGCYDDCGMPLDELSIILKIIEEIDYD